jgi:hypothetical protein
VGERRVEFILDLSGRFLFYEQKRWFILARKLD